MDRVRRIAGSASRRAMVRALLGLLGPALTLAFVLSILLTLADRTLLLGLSVWALVGAPALAAVGASIALAVHRRPDALGAAIEVDERLGLKDRLSSALEFEGRTGDAFAALAREEAERAAEGVRMQRAMPLRLGGTWAAWPLLGALAATGAILLPPLDWLRPGEAERIAEAAAEGRERELASAEVATAIQEARAATPLATDEQLRALDELAEELSGGGIRADDARAAAASTLEEMAGRADAESERLERELDALGDRLSALDSPAPIEEAPPSPVSELADALRRGEFDRAAATAKRLEEILDSPLGEELDAAQRERLAEELRALGERLAPPRPEETTPESSRLQGAGSDEAGLDALREQGLPEDEARRLSEMTDADALRDALQQEGMDPQAADRLAEQIARANREREAENAAAEKAKELSDALRETAEDVAPPRPPRNEPESPAGQPPQADRDPKGREGVDGQPSQERRPGAEGQPPSRDDAGQRSEGEKSGREEPRQGEESSPGAQEQQGGEPDKESGDPAPGGQPPHSPQDPNSDRGGASGEREGAREGQPAPGERQESPGQERGQGSEGADRPAAEERPSAGESAEGSPSPAEGAGAEDQPQGEGAGAARGVEKLREQLEQLSKNRDAIERLGQDSEAMRERARRMLENMSPEEQEEIRRWAEQMARERGDQGGGGGDGVEGGGGPRSGGAPTRSDGFRTENVDARRGEGEGRVAAEWFDPNAPAGEATTSRTASPGQVREAARSAERAVEEQAVSSRYNRLIREYFRRRVEEAERAPAQEAQDVPAAGAPGTSGG